MIIQGVTLTNIAVIDMSFATANLVLHYNPANTSSYSGSGTTITDLSTSGLSGTMSNITYTSPYFDYNGTSSQISIADNALLEPGSGNLTIEAWFNTTAFKTGSAGVVVGKFNNGGASSNVSYSIRTNNTGFVYAQIGNGSTVINSSNYQTVLSVWTHVVYVYKTGVTKTLETFINGTSIGSVSHTLTSILNSTNPLYIGSYNGGEYSQYFNGKIGIVRLYKSALTSAEVLGNYHNSKGTYGL